MAVFVGGEAIMSTELDDTSTPRPSTSDDGHAADADHEAAATNPSTPQPHSKAAGGSRLNESSNKSNRQTDSNAAPDSHQQQGEDDDDDEEDDEDDKDESAKPPHPSAIPSTSMQVAPQPYGYGATPPHPYHGGYYMGYGPPPPGPPPPQGAGAVGMISPPQHSDYGMRSPFGYADASQLHDPAPDTRRNRGGVTEPFPEKLHRMLDATEREGLSDVVSFFPHGRAFAIHKPRRFVAEIMPRFFRQSRLTSFQRQLNLYGFRRISQGPDNGGYYHELFLKGRPGLCVNMKRTKVKGVQKLKRDPETEPNFYSYPPIVKPPSHNAPGAPPPPISQNQQPTPPRASQPPSGPSTPVSPAAPTFYPPPYPMPYYGQYPPPSPYTAAQQNPPVYPYPPYYGYPWGYPPPPHGVHSMTPPPHQQQQQQTPVQQQQQYHQHHTGATSHGTPDTMPLKSEGDNAPIPPNVQVKDDDDDDDEGHGKATVHV